MPRRAAIIIAPLLVLVAGVGALVWRRTASPPQADVLLVTIDTLRADHLRPYGADRGQHETIDRLAARGVVFERAIAASAATAPSHASIMTGRWVRDHSVAYFNGATRLGGEPTLAEAFRAAGYATAAFVGNIMLRRRIGLDRGFEVYDDRLPDAERNRPRMFERTAEHATRRSLDWLYTVPDKPVFLWVHYQDPHGPYTPPPPFDTRFDGEPAAGMRPLPVLESNVGLGGIPAYQVLPYRRYLSQYENLYDGEIAYLDGWLGKLVAAFEARAPERGKIILLTSDHGESFGEGGVFMSHGHATTPDMAHVPLIIVAPQLTPERRHEPVSHVDIAPTLLDLAELDAWPGLAGLPLGRYLRSGTTVPSRVLYCDIGHEVSAYVEKRFYRLVHGSRAAVQHAWSDPGDDWGDGEPVAALPETMAIPVGSYVARQVHTEKAGPRSAGDTERLRALGYVE